MNYIAKVAVKAGLKKYKKIMQADKIDIFDLSANCKLNTCEFELKKIGETTEKTHVDNFLQSKVGQEFNMVAEYFETLRLAYTHDADTIRLLGTTIENEVIDITV